MKKSLMVSGAILGIFSSFGFAAGEKIIDKKEFNASQVKNVVIQASSGDASVLRGNDSKVVVELYTKKSKASEVKIDLTNGTLLVKDNSWGLTVYPPSVRIFVPNGVELGDVEIETSSGNIKVEGISSAKMQANSSSGSIDLETVSCSALTAASTSGKIEMDEIKASGDVKITTTSGSVDIDEVACADIKISTTSGSIETDQVTCKAFTVASTSGSVKAECLSSENFLVGLASGKANIELSKMVSKNSSIKTISGSISLMLPAENSGYTAIINTNSGTFKDEFTGLSSKHCSDAKSVYNSGSIEFNLKTNSGNVNIKKASL